MTQLKRFEKGLGIKQIQSLEELKNYIIKKIIDSHNNSSKNLWKTFGTILNKNKQTHKNR